MTANAQATLAIAIVAEVVATSLLKTSAGMTRPWPTAACVAGYGVAFYCLSLTLRTMPTGIAYAIWSGVGIVIVSAIGWLWFGQGLDRPALVGIALILLGVLTINLFSTSMPR